METICLKKYIKNKIILNIQKENNCLKIMPYKWYFLGPTVPLNIPALYILVLSQFTSPHCPITSLAI